MNGRIQVEKLEQAVYCPTVNRGPHSPVDWLGAPQEAVIVAGTA